MPERDASHWVRYNSEQIGREVRPLLVDALDHVRPRHDRVAIDIGCGGGTEAQLLLAARWTVYALDADEHSLRQLENAVPPNAMSRLNTRVVDLNDLPELPTADLIYAGYALPYARLARFHGMWNTVTSALAPGAVIAVNLFGNRDSWADREHETYMTESQARALFDGLELLYFHVEDEDGPAFSGPKHWHLFDDANPVRTPAAHPAEPGSWWRCFGERPRVLHAAGTALRPTGLSSSRGRGDWRDRHGQRDPCGGQSAGLSARRRSAGW